MVQRETKIGLPHTGTRLELLVSATGRCQGGNPKCDVDVYYQPCKAHQVRPLTTEGCYPTGIIMTFFTLHTTSRGGRRKKEQIQDASS